MRPILILLDQVVRAFINVMIVVDGTTFCQLLHASLATMAMATWFASVLLEDFLAWDHLQMPVVCLCSRLILIQSRWLWYLQLLLYWLIESLRAKSSIYSLRALALWCQTLVIFVVNDVDLHRLHFYFIKTCNIACFRLYSFRWWRSYDFVWTLISLSLEMLRCHLSVVVDIRWCDSVVACFNKSCDFTGFPQVTWILKVIQRRNFFESI